MVRGWVFIPINLKAARGPRRYIQYIRSYGLHMCPQLIVFLQFWNYTVVNFDFEFFMNFKKTISRQLFFKKYAACLTALGINLFWNDGKFSKLEVAKKAIDFRKKLSLSWSTGFKLFWTPGIKIFSFQNWSDVRFPIVIVSTLLHAESGPDDHLEDASHFMLDYPL